MNDVCFWTTQYILMLVNSGKCSNTILVNLPSIKRFKHNISSLLIGVCISVTKIEFYYKCIHYYFTIGKKIQIATLRGKKTGIESTKISKEKRSIDKLEKLQGSCRMYVVLIIC